MCKTYLIVVGAFGAIVILMCLITLIIRGVRERRYRKTTDELLHQEWKKNARWRNFDNK